MKFCNPWISTTTTTTAPSVSPTTTILVPSSPFPERRLTLRNILYKVLRSSSSFSRSKYKMLDDLIDTFRTFIGSNNVSAQDDLPIDRSNVMRRRSIIKMSGNRFFSNDTEHLLNHVANEWYSLLSSVHGCIAVTSCKNGLGKYLESIPQHRCIRYRIARPLPKCLFSSSDEGSVHCM